MCVYSLYHYIKVYLHNVTNHQCCSFNAWHTNKEATELAQLKYVDSEFAKENLPKL